MCLVNLVMDPSEIMFESILCYFGDVSTAGKTFEYISELRPLHGVIFSLVEQR